MVTAQYLHRAHRVKHIPTGLYYQPGHSNLSEKGKVYHTNSDVISANWIYGVVLKIDRDSKLYRKHKEVIDRYAKFDCNGQYVIYADVQCQMIREKVNC